MKTLSGAPLHGSTLSQAVKVADLVYFDGPLLSLFRNELSENFLFYWCDTDSHHNRWIVVKISENILEEYLSGSLPLLNVLTGPKDHFVYVVDINANGEHAQVTILSPAALPQDYLPKTDSYYAEIPILSENRLPEERIAIDGHWTFDDLSKFPHLYSALYSLVYLSKNKATVGKFEQFPMRDGFSAVHFFNGLKDLIPVGDRSELKAIRYASPGAIVFKVDARVAGTLRSIYTHYRDHSSSIAKSYASTHKILSQMGLLGKDVIKTKLPAADERYLWGLGEQLAGEIGLPNYPVIVERAGSPLMAMKIILAFYRRLERIAQFETEGKIRVPILP